MKRIWVGLLGLIVVGLALGKESALEVSLSETAEEYVYGIKNISTSPVDLLEMFVASPHQFGYWLFLYDQTSKTIEYANMSGIGSPKMLAKIPMPSIKLEPGMKAETAYRRKYIKGLFATFKPGRCYLLLAKYRQVRAGVVIESPASLPIEVCNP